MKTDGSDKRQITDFKSMSWAPFYHPSGKYVIFTSNKLGFENFELFIVDSNGEHEPVRVTFTPALMACRFFLPTGESFAGRAAAPAMGRRKFFWQIGTMRPRGPQLTRPRSEASQAEMLKCFRLQSAKRICNTKWNGSPIRHAKGA